jgi:hypothetical protein
MIPKVLHWVKIDFTPMRKPRLGFEGQNHIDLDHIEMASTAMVHFGLDLANSYAFWQANIPAIIKTFVILSTQCRITSPQTTTSI